jgi:hypothetical protein
MVVSKTMIQVAEIRGFYLCKRCGNMSRAELEAWFREPLIYTDQGCRMLISTA